MGRFARVAALALVFALLPAPRAARGDECQRVEMYSRQGCPHCEAAHDFLAALRRERPALAVVVHDVGADGEARRRLVALARRHDIAPVGVPAFSVCGVFLVGFRDPATTGREIVAALDGERVGLARSDPVVLPWVGPVDTAELGLLAFTLLVGLLDGLNPCAMWVLLLLLSVLVGIRDRRKLLLVAGTFVAVSGVAYFVFMAAWLNVFLWVGWSRPLQLVLGGIALGVGTLQLKDGLLPGRGPSLSIPAAARPGLYRRMRAILTARSLGAALVGAVTLAVMANTVELLCTAGLPALYTQVLSQNALTPWQYYGYLALYNLAYMADDLLMVTLAVVTLRRFKLQERHGRPLKLLSGGLMLALGLVLWFQPSWLRV